MNRRGSLLIEAFLDDHRWGLIVGKPGPAWTAQVHGRDPDKVLSDLAAAFSEILDGKDPYDALGIQRSPGKPSDPLRLDLKFELFDWWEQVKDEPLLEKQKWLEVKEKADQWLEDHDRDPVSVAALKKMYKEIEPFVGVRLRKGGGIEPKSRPIEPKPKPNSRN